MNITAIDTILRRGDNVKNIKCSKKDLQEQQIDLNSRKAPFRKANFHSHGKN